MGTAHHNDNPNSNKTSSLKTFASNRRMLMTSVFLVSISAIGFGSYKLGVRKTEERFSSENLKSVAAQTPFSQVSVDNVFPGLLEGTVASISDESITLTLSSGESRTYKLNEADTRISKEGKKATKDEIQPGQTVRLLEDTKGSDVARRIMIR